MTFVTVDLDSPSIVEVLEAWHYLDYVGGSVCGRVSSSGRGVHIRADGVEGEAEHHRRMAGDDSKRIELDIVRDYRPEQVLFDSKKDDGAGSWVNDVESLIKEYQDSTGFRY